MIFIRSGETFLDPTVHPQSLHSSQKLLGERFSVLHPGDHVHHHLGVALSLVVAEGDVEVRHGPEYGHQRLDGVAVNDRAVLLEVLAGEAALVDDLHLLHNGALAGFSSAWKENKVLVDVKFGWEGGSDISYFVIISMQCST